MLTGLSAPPTSAIDTTLSNSYQYPRHYPPRDRKLVPSSLEPPLPTLAGGFGSVARRMAHSVRSRLSSPAFAFATMPWKYPPGVVRKCSRVLGRDDRDRDRRLLAAHGQAGLAPEGFRHAELAAQPVRCVHDLRPGRVGPSQIGLQPRCQPHQLVRRAASAPCPFSGRLPAGTGRSVAWLRWPRRRSATTFLVSNYRILFRIKTWFVGILVGSVFGPQGVRIHSFGCLGCRPRQAGFPGVPAPNAAAAPGSRRQAPSPRAARPS